MNDFHSAYRTVPVRKAAMLIFSAAFSFVTAIAPISAKPDKTDEAKQAIQTEWSQMDQAFQQKDAEAYVKFTADNFVSINAKGAETTHGKKERRQKVQQGFDAADKVMEDAQVTASTKITSIALEKAGAVVTENSIVTFTGNTNGQQHVVQAVSIDRSFWMKAAKGWLEKRSKNISFHRTLDEQPSR